MPYSLPSWGLVMRKGVGLVMRNTVPIYPPHQCIGVGIYRDFIDLALVFTPSQPNRKFGASMFHFTD